MQSYNLGQNKMEQQTPIPRPPPPKSRMKPREGQKRAIFPSLIWGRGDLGFPFILSKIVAKVCGRGDKSKLQTKVLFRKVTGRLEFLLSSDVLSPSPWISVGAHKKAYLVCDIPTLKLKGAEDRGSLKKEIDTWNVKRRSMS